MAAICPDPQVDRPALTPRSRITQAFGVVLGALVEEYGVDIDGELHERTPDRMARALLEMTSGYADDPDKILSTCFTSPSDDVVVLEGIEFVSVCEHHLLPFRGTASVAYIPNGRIVGLSKLARVVECFARRLQVQERLTFQVAKAVERALDPLGVAVVMRSEHACLAIRGARKPGSRMSTSCMLGVFREKPEARAEVMALMGVNR